MKLSVVAAILEENLWKLEEANITNSSFTGGFTRVKNLFLFRGAVLNISSTGLFNDLTGHLRRMPVFDVAVDELDLTQAQHAELLLTLRLLHATVKELLKAIDGALPPPSELGVAIMLPRLHTFSELSNYTRLLGTALEPTVLHQDIGGSVVIESLEPGSKWLNVNLGNTKAVGLVAALVLAGSQINVQYLKYRAAERLYESDETQMEFYNKMAEKNLQLMQLYVDAEAKKVYDEHYEVDPEQLIRFRRSVEIFSEIIKDGGQIHPALTSPEYIKAMFPPSTFSDMLGSEKRHAIPFKVLKNNEASNPTEGENK